MNNSNGSIDKTKDLVAIAVETTEKNQNTPLYDKRVQKEKVKRLKEKFKYESKKVFTFPTEKQNISANYGSYSDGSYHGGIDYRINENSDIYASANGTVIKAEYHYSYGYYVEIRHSNGFSTLYAHNNELLVKVGDKVKQHDIIAKSGSTGNSTGPHCHFEIRIDDNRVNPNYYINKTQKEIDKKANDKK